MIVVQYIPDRDCIAVSGVPGPFPPGSLEVRRLGDLFAVASPHQDTLICAWADYTAWTRPDGSAFAGPDDAYAYLMAAVGMRVTATVDVSSVAVVAGQDMPAGLPVTVSRSGGQLVPARADAKPLSFVSGLLRAPVFAGFTAAPMRGAITLADWTAASGAPTRAVGQPYFLDATGGLTLSPDRSLVACVVRVGLSSAPNTLVVRPYDPIQL